MWAVAQLCDEGVDRLWGQFETEEAANVYAAALKRKQVEEYVDEDDAPYMRWRREMWPVAAERPQSLAELDADELDELHEHLYQKDAERVVVKRVHAPLPLR